jgi:N-acetyl-gamma-glutamyl-phosphate reductase
MYKKKIGIIGATGYTGSELVRILFHHPEVEISIITSESRAGEKFSDVHPFFRYIVDDDLMPVSEIEHYELDLVFLALPHGVSMEFARQFKNKSFRMVDLSGDFRLSSPAVYEQWYQKEHTWPDGFDTAVFGLPELFFNTIKNAKLVANPGCFPTGAILGSAPLIAHDLVESSPVIIDSKTGVTGAGVKAKNATHFPHVNDNFKAYGIKTHRHTIEIQEVINQVSEQPVKVQFTPHLLPVDRGILSTIYLQSKHPLTEHELRDVYQKYYAGAPFIRICKTPPAIKDVRGTNYCDIYVTHDDRTGMIMVIAVIDNLVKGAAGQAVQNMNIMMGMDQALGLDQIPMNP